MNVNLMINSCHKTLKLRVYAINIITYKNLNCKGKQNLNYVFITFDFAENRLMQGKISHKDNNSPENK